MKKQSYVAVPNCIITDPMLYSSTKRVLAAMLAYSSRHGTVRKSLSELAAISECSAATVQHALDELQDRGIIHRIRCFRYSRFLSRPVYAKNAYQIKKAKLAGSYTLVPRELLQLKVTHSAFVAALYIYMTSGREGRSYASLRTAAKKTHLAKATICRALKALREAQAIVRYFCLKANRALSCNSYYPTAWIRPGHPGSLRGISANPFRIAGGLNFEEHRVTNKIAGDYTMRRNEKGVGEFGSLTNFERFSRTCASPFLSPA